MKRFKLLMIGVVLSISILFGGLSMPMICYAESEGPIQSRMINIYTYSADITISESGVASVFGYVRCKTDVSHLAITLTLQMSVSGRWVDVKTWSASTSDDALTVADTYQLTSRGTYRVVMDVTADSEEKQAISAYRTF